MSTVYEKLVEIGATMDSHESDLYVKSSDAVWQILKASGARFTIFTGSDRAAWYEVPFAYDPWWRQKEGR